jgi:transposase InsO family protein
MMLDADVVAVPPASVYRVLKRAHRPAHRQFSPSKKGSGFIQPHQAHEHWYVDISCIDVAGSLFYLTSVLDGFSRYIVYSEVRERMTERDIATIVQRALASHPAERPRIIANGGPQFVARDFKEFLRLMGGIPVKPVRSLPKPEDRRSRRQTSLKPEPIRPAAAAWFHIAKGRIAWYVNEYNKVRLHTALGYVTPFDKLMGRDQEVHAQRSRKLAEARARRRAARRRARGVA